METCSTGPGRQLGNRRQIISHPINSVGWKQDAPHDDTFPIDVHFVQSEFVGQRHVAWLSGSSLHFTPGLLRFLRMVSYRMTAVTLKRRGTPATRAGPSIAARSWLATAGGNPLIQLALVAASHGRFVFRASINGAQLVKHRLLNVTSICLWTEISFIKSVSHFFESITLIW